MYRYMLLCLFLLLPGCSDGIGPGDAPQSHTAPPPAATAEARVIRAMEWYEAVGTVQPKTETTVEAQITGRVLDILVRPGQSVQRGDPLVKLDSRESTARLERTQQAAQSAASGVEQARQSLAAATAAFDKARSTYRRMEQLYKEKVITQEELEQSESAYLQARAEHQRAQGGLEQARSRLAEAQKGVEETRIGLGYTDIVSQVDGEVAKRFAEPGDLAFPGKPLLSIQTSGALRLEARVREGAIGRVRLGMELPVDIPALGPSGSLTGVVEEMEPLADPGSRSFLVKVGLPHAPGLYPGMFGNLMVPLDTVEVVRVPAAAVRSVGQLDTVRIRTRDGWETVYVKAGRTVDGETEILSGLSGGETVALPSTGESVGSNPSGNPSDNLSNNPPGGPSGEPSNNPSGVPSSESSEDSSGDSGNSTGTPQGADTSSGAAESGRSTSDAAAFFESTTPALRAGRPC